MSAGADLAQLQRAFAAFLRDDDAPPVIGVEGRSRRGLPVYHHAYRASLIEALRDVFERTHSWLGDELFDKAARHHIAAHPPSSWTLSDYGIGFDDTLAELFTDNPEVPELAWLDWTLRAAFNGPDAPPLDMAGLADVDWDTAPLRLVPTFANRTVLTNVALVWQGLSDDEGDPPAAALLAEPAILTVWRHDLMPRFQTVDGDEARALLLAAQGMSFGAICADLASRDGDADRVAAQAGAMLGRWISEGVLAHVG